MTGTVTISLELELGWGVARFGMLDKLSPGRHRETRTLHTLLELCETFDLPLTFNVVGHLFLEECDGHHDGPYPPGWFDIDPGTSVAEHPAFYAPDLIAAIQSSSTPHEICTHTFSHIECGEHAPATVAHDLRHARQLHREHGADPLVSLVPPVHNRPPRDVLHDVGIEIVRVPHYRAPGHAHPRTPVHKLRELLFGDHPIGPPHLIDGIVETYSPEYKTFAAQYLPSGTYPAHLVYRLLPLSARKRLHRRNHRRALDRVSETDGHVHFWSHLYDISNDHQWPQIDALLADLARRRDDGDVEVLTMAQLNDRVRTDVETRRECTSDDADESYVSRK